MGVWCIHICQGNCPRVQRPFEENIPAIVIYLRACDMEGQIFSYEYRNPLRFRLRVRVMESFLEAATA